MKQFNNFIQNSISEGFAVQSFRGNSVKSLPTAKKRAHCLCEYKTGMKRHFLNGLYTHQMSN